MRGIKRDFRGQRGISTRDEKICLRGRDGSITTRSRRATTRSRPTIARDVRCIYCLLVMHPTYTSPSVPHSPLRPDQNHNHHNVTGRRGPRPAHRAEGGRAQDARGRARAPARRAALAARQPVAPPRGDVAGEGRGDGRRVRALAARHPRGCHGDDGAARAERRGVARHAQPVRAPPRCVGAPAPVGGGADGWEEWPADWRRGPRRGTLAAASDQGGRADAAARRRARRGDGDAWRRRQRRAAGARGARGRLGRRSRRRASRRSARRR